METGVVGELVVRGANVMNDYRELPQVAEAAVVGIHDSILGEAIKAYIVLNERAALTEEDVLAHCKERP